MASRIGDAIEGLGVALCVVLLLLVPYTVGQLAGYEQGYRTGIEAGRAIEATPNDIDLYDCAFDR